MEDQMQRLTRSPNYLIKAPYAYYFRIKVHKDLQAIISRKELRYSLGTGNLTAAKIKARHMAGLVGWIKLLFATITQ
jgi:hypothetical protein